MGKLSDRLAYPGWGTPYDQQNQYMPVPKRSAMSVAGPAIGDALKMAIGAPSQDEGAQMQAQSGLFQQAFADRDRRGMAEAIGQQAGVMAPYMAGAGVTKGVGLPMDQAARMSRAAGQGFDTSQQFFHGTDNAFDAFDVSKAGTGSNAGVSGKERAVFLTDNPAVADSYLAGGYVRADAPSAVERGVAPMGEGVGRWYSDGAKVMPVYVRNLDNFDQWDFGGGGYSAEDMASIIKDAKKGGRKGVVIENIKDPGILDAVGPIGSPRKASRVIAVFNPKDVRSVFAKFDAKKVNSKDLLAGVGGGVAAVGLIPDGQEESQ